MKRMIGDIAQSATVEGRRSPNTFIEQLSYLDALTSPISTAKQAFVKEISELNTRG